MKLRRPVLVLSFLFVGTSASPINSSIGSPASTCLAVVLTMFCVLFLLVTLKYLFTRSRRAAVNLSSSNPSSYTVDSYHRSSTSFIPADHINEKMDKSGILVGLLGSPAWETRLEKTIDLSSDSKREYSQASFMYQLHTNSRRRQSSQFRRSIGSGGRATRRSGSMSVASIVDSRVLYDIQDGTGQKRLRSIHLPAYPVKAHLGSASLMRRFSLPATSHRGEINEAAKRKKHSSLKSIRSGKSQQGEVSLRLVEPLAAFDTPLPLSPASTVGSFQTKRSSRTSIKSAPPVPPLPTASMSWPSHPQAHADNTGDVAPLYISHPYALAAKKTKTVRPTAIKPQAKRSRHSVGNSAIPTDAVRVDSLVNNQERAGTRQPLASIHPSLNFTPLDISFPPSKLSPPMCALPMIPSAAVIDIQSRKPKRSSLRSKRSPAIGPSPLRKVILPDSSDLDLSARSHPSDGKENMAARRSALKIGLSIGYPSDNDCTVTTRPRKSRHSAPAASPRRASTKSNEVDDSDVLLGIIRELVEETREWDSSLFVDDNFKTLIQSSAVSDNSQDNSGSSGDSDLTTSSEASQQGRKHGKRVESSELVSFWEEGGWVDDLDSRDSVGLAC